MSMGELDKSKVENYTKLAEIAIKLEKYRKCLLDATRWLVFGSTFAAFYLIMSSIAILIIQLKMLHIVVPFIALSPLLPLAVSVAVVYKIVKLPVMHSEEFRGKFMALCFSISFASVYAIVSIVFSILKIWQYDVGKVVGSYIYATVWYIALGLAFLIAWLRGLTQFRGPSIAVFATSWIVYMPLLLYLNTAHGMMSTYAVYYMPLIGGLLAAGLMFVIYVIKVLQSLYKSAKALYVKE